MGIPLIVPVSWPLLARKLYEPLKRGKTKITRLLVLGFFMPVSKAGMAIGLETLAFHT